MAERTLYRRVVLKLSGEALMGNHSYGIDPSMIEQIAQELGEVYGLGVEIAVVVGGGNIFRGVSLAAQGMNRATGDYMGMLATLMNALALQQALERHGVPTRVLSAIDIREIAEPFIRRRAIRHLEKGRVVIFAAGTGLPFFTTDTAAALRAVEIDADVILKATKVDGIYSTDPVKDPKARRYDHITFTEVIRRNLKVMDVSAVSLARDNNIPIIVFNLLRQGNIKKAVLGQSVGTLVEGVDDA